MLRLAILVLALAAPAVAQEKPPLKWGMDETGGAPYVFDNQTKGFEVELAAYLAEKLGRTSEPVNGEWNKLPDLLQRGEVDIVLNGYEYAEHFKDQASIPYYVYRLRMTVATGSKIQSWEEIPVDPEKPGEPLKKVGVLTGSAAMRYMQRKYGDMVKVEVFDDVANTFKMVQDGTLTATVQDNPAANFYVAEEAAKGGGLRSLIDTRAMGYYVILTRKADAQLREAINTALRQGIEDGTLEKIYRKYGLWNRDQERLLYLSKKPVTELEGETDDVSSGVTAINWSEALTLLGYAALMTIFLAVVSMPIATLLGMAIAAARLYGPRWLGWLFTLYVEVIRGTPLLLQLYVLFYILPEWVPLFKALPKEVIGILGLAINYSASEAEHFRGAFLNLPRGQMEAAESLGMTKWTVIRRILTPQAFRAALPSVTNDFVALFKDTAVCSVIAVMELTKQYNTLYNNHRDQILSLAVVTAAMYLLMSYPLALVARRLERGLKAGER